MSIQAAVDDLMARARNSDVPLSTLAREAGVSPSVFSRSGKAAASGRSRTYRLDTLIALEAALDRRDNDHLARIEQRMHLRRERERLLARYARDQGDEPGVAES